MVEDFNIYAGTLSKSSKTIKDSVESDTQTECNILHAKMIPSGMETDLESVKSDIFPRNKQNQLKPINEHYDDIILHEESQQLIQKEFNSELISSEEPMINYSVLSLATLHNDNLIQITVSDVISPSNFSVQISQFENDLLVFEKKMQAVYKISTDALTFKENPPVNCVCIAKYDYDGEWYRATIKGHIHGNKVKVFYVDYGNESVVQLKDIRKIKPEFLKMPFQAVYTSLNDVDSSLNGNWSLQQKSSFDELVLGNKFFASFKGIHKYLYKPVNVTLFLKKVTGELKDLSEILVERGITDKKSSPFLQSKEKILANKKRVNSEEVDILKTKSTNENFTITNTGESVKTEQNLIDNNKCKNDEVSGGVDCKLENVSDIDKCNENITSYEDVYKQKNSFDNEQLKQESILDDDRRKNSNSQEDNCFNDSMRAGSTGLTIHDAETEKSKSLKKEFNSSQSNEGPYESKDDIQAAFSRWNPMKDDFYNDRNKEVLNVDDACVAVEGVDYEKIEVCQHHINNKCWYGDECNKLHTNIDNAETKSLKLRVWMHDIPSIKLQNGQHVLLRVTNYRSTSDVLCHLIYNYVPAHPIYFKNVLPESLDSLQNMMKSYYSKYMKGPSEIDMVSVGQMFIYLDPSVQGGTYYRVSIRKVLQQQIVSVLLIDFGQMKEVPKTCLLHFNQQFKLTPIQSLSCDLSLPHNLRIEVGGIYEAKFIGIHIDSMLFQLCRNCNTSALTTTVQNHQSSFIYPPQHDNVFMWRLPSHVMYPPSFYHPNNHGYMTTPFSQSYLPPHTPFMTNSTSLRAPLVVNPPNLLQPNVTAQPPTSVPY